MQFLANGSFMEAVQMPALDYEPAILATLHHSPMLRETGEFTDHSGRVLVGWGCCRGRSLSRPA